MKKRSASYASSTEEMKRRRQGGYRSEFKTIKSGNDIPPIGEFARHIDNRNRSRWECSVMDRFSDFFSVQRDPQTGEAVAHLRSGVAIASAKQFVYHDLRTVKLRTEVRGSSSNDLVKAYNLARECVDSCAL